MVKIPHSGERFSSVIKWIMLIFRAEHGRAKYKGTGKIPEALDPQTGVPSSVYSPQINFIGGKWKIVHQPTGTMRLVFYSGMPHSFHSFPRPSGTTKVFLRMLGLEKDCG